MRFLLILLTIFITNSISAQSQSPPRFVTVNGQTYDLHPPKLNKTYPYDIALKDGDRKEVKSSKVFSKGKRPVVLVFWMTTCVPCQYELRALKEKYDGWKEIADFDLYAIAMDFEKRSESVYSKIASAGWKWETYYDYERKFTQIMPNGLNGLPQTFIFDKKGEMVYHRRKYRMGQEDEILDKIIDLQ